MAIKGGNNPKGNPDWKPGVSGNPNGRPKGTVNKKLLMEKVQDRLRRQHHSHPVDRLVSIAKLAEAGNDLELAADIWLDLLAYCEPTKKPIATQETTPTPEGSKASAEATLALLKQLEGDHGSINQSGSIETSVDDGEAPVPPEAGSTEDIR